MGLVVVYLSMVLTVAGLVAIAITIPYPWGELAGVAYVLLVAVVWGLLNLGAKDEEESNDEWP